MANSLSASFAEIWAKEQQLSFYKKNVAMEVADTSFKGEMSKGDTLNRPRRSALTNQSYTRGTEVSIDDITDTNEQLSVNKAFAIGFYVDDFDKIQSSYDEAMNYGEDSGKALATQIDADVLGEVVNAGTTLSTVTISSSTVFGMFSGANKAIKKQNVDSEEKVAVISPEVEASLLDYLTSKGTVLGDTTTKEAFFGNVLRFKVYVSNNLTNVAVAGIATNPTANDTITIDGVTFTFVSSIGTTAGNVLIGANVDATRASLATLINAPATTTSTGVALSSANQRKVGINWSAVNDDTANTITVTVKGAGSMACSETFTASGDTFTSIKQLNVFGVAKKCTTLVIQSEPTIQAKEVSNKFGKNILNGVLYGVKTFTDNAKGMVCVPVDSSAF